MSEELDNYDVFVNKLKEKYPEMYADVPAGISVGEGWYEIVEWLSDTIYQEVKWNNDTRERLLKDNKYGNKIPELMEYPKVIQVKEKFGGLRFYADNTSKYARGAITMAEIWAGRTCETCGERGKRRSGGWMRTLCDKHEVERQQRMENHKREFNGNE